MHATSLLPLAGCFLITALAGVSRAAEKDRYGDALPPGAIARLGTPRLGQSSVIRQVAYSPDGKTLVSASKSIRVWDAATGRLLREMADDPNYMIVSLAVAPDGRTLAWAGRGEEVWLQSAATGLELHRLKGHAPYSECVAFSPEGTVLASGGRDGRIRLWDVAKGSELQSLDCPGTTAYLAFAPGGKTLLSFSQSGSVNGSGECRLWDLETRKPLLTREGVFAPTALSPDGRRVITGAEGKRLLVLDATTGKELRAFALPRREGVSEPEAARCVAFSRDGKLLAAADMTDRVHVWEAETGKELFCPAPLPNWVESLAFSPDGKTLAVAAWQRILFWEATTGKERLPLAGHATQVSRVAVAPDAKTVATWAADGVTLWDPLTGRERHKLSGRGKLLGFSPGGNLLLGAKGSIVEWLIDQDKALRMFKVYEHAEPDEIGDVSAVHSRDDKTMASGSDDRTVRLWDLKTGKVLWHARREDKGVRFPADIGRHRPLGFSHDGKSLVSFGHDTVVHLWDAATGKEVRWFRTDADVAALSPDGKFLLTMGEHVAAPDGTSEMSGAAPPRLYDLTKGGEPRPIKFHPKVARAAAFSPDGRTVALASGADIALVECPSGKVIRELKGHEDLILDLAFSPDGRLLVSGSYDRTAIVWRVR